MHLQLGIGAALEAFHQDEIHQSGIEQAKHRRQLWVLTGLELGTLHDPPLAGGKEDLAGAGLANFVAVLAWTVDLDPMVAVLEVTDAPATLTQQRDQLPDEGRLAGTAGGDETDNGDGTGSDGIRHAGPRAGPGPERSWRLWNNSLQFTPNSQPDQVWGQDGDKGPGRYAPSQRPPFAFP